MKQAPPIRNDQCARTFVMVDDGEEAASFRGNAKRAACWKVFISQDRGFEGQSELPGG